MTFSRAQEALARPGEHVTALREFFARFCAREQVFRTIAEEITDVDICYPMGSNGKTWVADIMCAGKGVLLDLAGRSTLKDAVAKWADRIEGVTARCYQRHANLDGMLIRPDGYVAWVVRSSDGDDESCGTLAVALRKWFGAHVSGALK
jgi:hypothetical protein